MHAQPAIALFGLGSFGGKARGADIENVNYAPHANTVWEYSIFVKRAACDSAVPSRQISEDQRAAKGRQKAA